MLSSGELHPKQAFELGRITRFKKQICFHINHIELRVASVDASEKFHDPLCEHLGYYKHHRIGASILYRSKEGIGDLIIKRTRTACQGKFYDKEAPGFAT